MRYETGKIHFKDDNRTVISADKIKRIICDEASIIVHHISNDTTSPKTYLYYTTARHAESDFVFTLRLLHKLRPDEYFV